MKNLSAGFLFLALLAVSSGVAQAAPIIGFQYGMDDQQALAIRNISTSATITSLTITLPATTFFDTADGGFGALGQAFKTGINDGVLSAVYPDPVATDGKSVATIYFDGFDPLDAIYIQTDFDLFANQGLGGDAIGTQVAVVFSNGVTLHAVVANVPIGFSFSTHQASFSFSAAAQQELAVETPEPASLAVWSLIGLAGAVAWRRKKQTSQTNMSTSSA